MRMFVLFGEAQKRTMKNNLRELRKIKMLTQTDVATDLGITQATLARLEVGKIQLKPERIKEFAEYFGVEERRIQDTSLLINTNDIDPFTKEYIVQIIADNQELRKGRLVHLEKEIEFLRSQNSDLQKQLLKLTRPK